MPRGSVFLSLVYTGDSGRGSGCVSGQCVCDYKWYVVLGSCHLFTPVIQVGPCVRWLCSRLQVVHGLGFLSLTFQFDVSSFCSRGMRCLLDGTRAMEHGSPDVCSMTIFKCVVVMVICSVLTHSWNTCQGTVHVQSCLLHAARRVCTRDTLCPSVRPFERTLTPTRSRVHSNAGFLFVACLNTSVLVPCCLCFVERALNESAIVLTSGTCGTAVLTTPPKSWRHAYLDQTEVVVIFLSRSVRVDSVAPRIRVGSRSATLIHKELHSCFESCLDSRETIVSLGTVSRTPQSHEHVLVVSCVGASKLLSTIFTLSFFFGGLASRETISRANRVCRATNRYQGSVYGAHSFRLFIPPNQVLE